MRQEKRGVYPGQKHCVLCPTSTRCIHIFKLVVFDNDSRCKHLAANINNRALTMNRSGLLLLLGMNSGVLILELIFVICTHSHTHTHSPAHICKTITSKTRYSHTQPNIANTQRNTTKGHPRHNFYTLMSSGCL